MNIYFLDELCAVVMFSHSLITQTSSHLFARQHNFIFLTCVSRQIRRQFPPMATSFLTAVSVQRKSQNIKFKTYPVSNLSLPINSLMLIARDVRAKKKKTFIVRGVRQIGVSLISLTCFGLIKSKKKKFSNKSLQFEFCMVID